MFLNIASGLQPRYFSYNYVFSSYKLVVTEILSSVNGLKLSLFSCKWVAFDIFFQLQDCCCGLLSTFLQVGYN
jgi:hypothetical protein